MKMGIHRRRFLRGVAAGSLVTLGLPWMEIFQARAQSAGFPTRFGLFFWGNGMLPDRWVPEGQGVGDAWSLSEQLRPLAPVKDDISVITGMEIKTINEIPHHSGSAGILTGQSVLVRSHEDNTFRGPSIDQQIADSIGGETRFRSREFGAEGGRGLSHIGPDSINPSVSDPATFFADIFGADFRAPGDMTEPNPRLALRRSVLDLVSGDIQSFKRDLGQEDLRRLDQHLTGIRDLERRIERLEEEPPNLAACERPLPPDADYSDVNGRPQLSVKNRLLCDIAVMALACDQTRVISNFITKPLTNGLFGEATAGHHQLTHDEPNPQPMVNSIVLAIMEELSYYIQALRSVQEGDGTLDHMVLLATSEVSYGRIHSLDEFPLIIAGSAGGRLRTGMHYRSQLAENTSTLMLSIMRACGVNAPSFGEGEGRVVDGLSAIEV